MHKQQILEQLNGNTQLKEYLGDLVVATRDLYRDTRKDGMNMFPRPEAKDFLPALRRASFETKMSQVADRVGVSQAAVLNQARNSSHREIKIDQFLLVGNHVSSPGVMVRDAIFRKTLAAGSQLSFSFLEEENDQDSGHVFGVLMHGETFDEKQDISYPFLSLGFPNKELTDYVLKINLLDMFKNKFRVDTDNEVVQINDNIDPVFRDTEEEAEKEV